MPPAAVAQHSDSWLDYALPHASNLLLELVKISIKWDGQLSRSCAADKLGADIAR